MHHAHVARVLTHRQQAILLKHLKGPQQVIVGGNKKALNGLLTRGLLQFCTKAGGYSILSRACFTNTTEDGRAVVGFVLGRFADELIAAGFIETGLIKLESRGVKLSLTADDYADSHEEPAEASTEA